MNLTSLMLVAKHTLTLLLCLSVGLIKHVVLNKNSIVDSSSLRVLKAKLHLGFGGLWCSIALNIDILLFKQGRLSSLLEERKDFGDRKKATKIIKKIKQG